MQKMTKQTRAIIATKKALLRLWARLSFDDRKAFIACLDDETLAFHPKDDPRKATIAGGAV
jgi:hypothetical protein